MQGIRNLLNPTSEKQSAKSKLRTLQDKPSSSTKKKKIIIKKKKRNCKEKKNKGDSIELRYIHQLEQWQFFIIYYVKGNKGRREEIKRGE